MIDTWIMAEAAGTVQTIMSFLGKGGLFMWPLLGCSIVSVTTMILRGIALREKNVMPLVIQSEIERLAPGASPERLTRTVSHDQSSLARITRVALQHLRGPRSENVEVVETRARHEMVRLEKGLIVLEVITGIAPLLGLIGAVSGLVNVFSHLGLGSGASGTLQIALGIAEALKEFKKDQTEGQINPPETATAKKVPAELEHAIVSVDQNDDIKLDGRAIGVNELETAVHDLPESRKSTLALQADKKASFGAIIKVMDALKLAGVKNLPAFSREEK